MQHKEHTNNNKENSNNNNKQNKRASHVFYIYGTSNCFTTSSSCVFAFLCHCIHIFIYAPPEFIALLYTLTHTQRETDTHTHSVAGIMFMLASKKCQLKICIAQKTLLCIFWLMESPVRVSWRRPPALFATPAVFSSALSLPLSPPFSLSLCVYLQLNLKLLSTITITIVQFR